MREIEELRKSINDLDEVIVQIVAARLSICKAIGRYKRLGQLEVLDKNREAFLANFYKDLAKKYEVDSNLISKMFDLILDHSREVQAIEQSKTLED